MERSRKRVMKAARNDYQQGLENQKVRLGPPIALTSQLTDGSPQACLRCACLHQAIQEAYHDVNNSRTRRFPSFERSALVSLLMLALDTSYCVSLVRLLFIHANATTQVCLVHSLRPVSFASAYFSSHKERRILCVRLEMHLLR